MKDCVVCLGDPDLCDENLCDGKGFAPLKIKTHTGTHPVFENTCDDHKCWCHKPTCASKKARNGEKCDCGTMTEEETLP